MRTLAAMLHPKRNRNLNDPLSTAGDGAVFQMHTLAHTRETGELLGDYNTIVQHNLFALKRLSVWKVMVSVGNPGSP